MNNLFGIIILFIGVVVFKKFFLFSYVPKKKNKNIYQVKWAHRGFHFECPENSLKAYEEAIRIGLGVELDIRETMDGKIVCFHDRFTKRLLGIPGSVKLFNCNYVTSRKFLESNEYVCTLAEALTLINGQVPVLIDVKGYMSNSYRRELMYTLGRYNGIVYLHTDSLRTYFILVTVFGKYNVFWVFNVFRKRFQFIKSHHYKAASNKYKRVINMDEINIPTIDDISEVLVSAFENSYSIKEACLCLSEMLNKYESRVDENHWLNNYLLLHRSIVSSDYKENSLEAFEHAIKFADENNLNVALELDVIIYKGDVICYHSDRISKRLGQAASCAEKVARAKAAKFKDVVLLVKEHSNVALIIDIKDYKFKNRILEEKISKIISECGYKGKFAVQSFNPLVLMWFEKFKPEYIRGQVGHSLSGLTKYVPFFRFPWAVNVVLFEKSSADYAVYDNSNFIYLFIKYNKDIRGRSVLIYAPKSYNEIETFIGKEGISNFIVENVADETAWPKWWLQKFKI